MPEQKNIKVLLSIDACLQNEKVNITLSGGISKPAGIMRIIFP